MLICNFNLLPDFYKDYSLQFVTCFRLQFSPMPTLVLFIISMVSWGFLLTKKIVINQPFSGPARHPLPLQFWCDIIVLRRGLTSILFCSVAQICRIKSFYINLPFEVCWIHLCLFPSLKTRSFFIWIQRQSFLEIRELTV